MNDQELYLTEYLNSKSAILNAYIRNYNNKNNFKSDKYNTIKNILSLINGADNIIEKIGVDEIYFNDFFNSLMKIYKKGINDVDLLIEKYNYQKIIDNKYDDCIKQIRLGYLESNNIPFINFYLINGLIKRQDEEEVYKYFIKDALNKDIKISYEAFEKVILYYTKLEMAKLKVAPICQILPLDKIKKIVKKRAIKKRISIAKEDIENLYKDANYGLLINTFMDLYYIKNYKNACNKKIDSLMIREIKEEILTFYIPNYYKENKKYIMFELNARKYANKKLDLLFKEFGIEFKNGFSFENENKLIEADKKETNRIYNGKEMKLDDIFKIFSNKYPKFLSNYQLLSEN